MTPERRAQLAVEAARLVCLSWLECTRAAEARREIDSSDAYDRAQSAILDALLRAESSPPQAVSEPKETAQ